jgi:hypothetical protein
MIRIAGPLLGLLLISCTTQALAEGIVRVETQSEKAARHYAAESMGEDPNSIVGPQRVVAFPATGVRLIAQD